MKQLKHPPSSTTSSHDPKLLVRETLRITADLASAPPSAAVPPVSPLLSSETTTNSLNFGVGVDRQFVDSSLRLLCCEEIDGRRWKYFTDESSCSSSSGGRVGGGCEQLKLKKKKNVIRAVSLHSPQAPIEEFMAFIRSYVVPEGFPNSVTPSYVPYMTWRALKHFFGGAMGVFTTQTLLNSVGVSKHRTTPGAVAINWILKDGAGRVGKMLYARQGKKFDYDLKQLRFAGDLLMELGAGVELVTAIVPQFFLPLACAANVAKNVGAVTSTSTRTPIYKAFAKGENIGDVTAKGECVGNLADLLGTGLSILISKRNPSLVKTFAFLSFGYVFSSYREVKSVVLHTLNRARFTVAVESFLKTGRVPTLQDGNSRENIFNFPWKNHRPIILGPRFREAVEDPNSFLAVKPIFEKENYIVTYNPSKGNIYVLLKDQAKSDDVLKAAFHGHVLLHIIHSSTKKQSSSRRQHEDELSLSLLSAADLQAHVVDSYKMVSALYMPFKSKAKEQGWVMSESLLNPGRARLCEMVK
ncbi:Protein root UVB sensitive 6 [Capsicum annuum]|uniref:protein root UVB sensitive 6 n=1 Tax=Capsicum annuum TaxID=4072 RepID=UPI001FB168AD|nr:protein root UVB sensitive 6 [Capsicum annuum]KAF3682327.1 Protein root UVB sensitive 6 [Capsicum annuum]